MDEAKVCTCSDPNFIKAMVSYIAQTESYFGEVQRGTDSPSQLQKENYLHSVLHRSVTTFVSRYGEKLTENHVDYFIKYMSDDEDLAYMLATVKKEANTRSQRVKNRRFTAMKEMLANGDYFSDEQMKQRDPLLYDQMVGKYLTEEEIKNQSDDLLRQHTGISTILMEQMDSKDAAHMYDKQLSQEECQQEEGDSDDDDDMEGEETDAKNLDDVDGRPARATLPVAERIALREEFLHTMQERFLAGHDQEYEYSLRIEKDAIPSVHLDGISKAQSLEGVRLETQLQSPSKRSAAVPSTKERQRLLTTDPSLLQPISKPSTSTSPAATSFPRVRRARPRSARMPSKEPAPSKRGSDHGTQFHSKIIRHRVRSKHIQCHLEAVDVDAAKGPEQTPTAEPEDIESEGEYEKVDDEWISDDEMDSDDECISDDDDADDSDESSPKRNGRWYDEKKYIVTESKLQELLSRCRVCGGRAVAKENQVQGAFVDFDLECMESACGHACTWQTSDVINQKYIINVLLSATILFAGGLAKKFFRALMFLNIPTPSLQTHYRNQANYLHGVMRSVYKKHQKTVIDDIRSQNRSVALAGDGRSDSPGHSAIYGLYTLMDCEDGKIACVELVKSTEGSSSNDMELEGLLRCRKHLEELQVRVTSLTTDTHLQIQAYMRKSWGAVDHFYDIWHISKALKKKLAAVSLQKTHRKVAKWVKSITNHLYWVVSTTDAESELRRQKWMSVLDHICDQHTFEYSEFPTCEHGPMENYHRDWLTKGSSTYHELRPILHHINLLKAIQKAGKENTAGLESFHSALNGNAPKMMGFGYSSQLTRVQLSVLHHNENSQRAVQTSKDGMVRYRMVNKKATKLNPTCRVAATYRYVDDLMMTLETHLVTGSKAPANDPLVPTLSSQGPQVDKETDGKHDIERSKEEATS